VGTISLAGAAADCNRLQRDATRPMVLR